MSQDKALSSPRAKITVWSCGAKSDYHEGRTYLLIHYGISSVTLGLLGWTGGGFALPRTHATKSRKSAKAQDMRSADYLARYARRHPNRRVLVEETADEAAPDLPVRG